MIRIDTKNKIIILSWKLKFTTTTWSAAAAARSVIASCLKVK